MNDYFPRSVEAQKAVPRQFHIKLSGRDIEKLNQVCGFTGDGITQVFRIALRDYHDKLVGTESP